MKTNEAYDIWSAQYDTNKNKTRDLEAVALRSILSKITFGTSLEIGCGTGKNTEWLASRSEQVTAVDFSKEMLAKARAKISSDAVQFVQADITENWNFKTALYDLVSFSLVLEHIANLDTIFSETSKALNLNGYVYIGELHPFKQYAGTKARFESEAGTQVLDCYTHHVSDFTEAAKKHGLTLINIQEFFEEEDRSTVPRILALLLKKV